MSLQKHLNSIAKRLGYRVVPRDSLADDLIRRKLLLQAYGIDLVLDVGANIGQYGTQLRRQLGYRGRIVSFEPMRSAFERLRSVADKDALWEVRNVALGDVEGQQSINVSANSHSSSLLNMLPIHERAAPDSAYAAKELIEIRTLDSIFGEMAHGARSTLLKIDTQGFEMHVLAGAARSLPKINTLQLELSLVELYEGEMLYDDVCAWLAKRGYSLVSIEPGFFDRESGRLLQFDGIFHRKD